MAKRLNLAAMGNSQDIYTVSRLNKEIRSVLERGFSSLVLSGEISNFIAPASGHWYFTLKDDRAQVKAAMWRGNNRGQTFRPTNGAQVTVRARVSLYEPRGDYQLIVEHMAPAGEGLLKQEFDALKMRLAAEGLFSSAYKKPLPTHINRVGVITSATGAAIRDILTVLKRRAPQLEVVIYPAMVQGADAHSQLIEKINIANQRNEVDVLILGRGGGSLEDLWCFNNEILARTISASQIPIISAVGHEVDVTIADFVADVRAPTPSAAAELVSRDNSHKDQALVTRQHKLASAMRYYLAEQKQQAAQLLHRLERQHPSYQLQRQSQQLDELDLRLRRAMQRFIDTRQQAIERKHHRLQLNSPVRHLAQQKSRLDRVEQKLLDAMDRKLLTVRHQLAMAAEKLEAVSPLATLKRGYSITQTEQGKVITQAEDVKTGDRLVTRLANGEISSTVN